MPLGYKVVALDYHSAMTVGSYSIYYGIGRTVHTKQNTIGLMVFDILTHAVDFLGYSKYSKIHAPAYRILCVGWLNRHILPTPEYIFSDPKNLFSLYEVGAVSPTQFRTPPNGTICLSKLKVLKEVPICQWDIK